MANRLQDAYRNNLLGDGTYANVQLDSDTIRAAFYDSADGALAATAANLSIPVGAGWVPATPRTAAPALGTKTTGTVAVGIFDAADTTFTALTGDVVEYLVLFKADSSDALSILIAFWDSATGLPLTPNGGDVTVAWNASGIFGV